MKLTDRLSLCWRILRAEPGNCMEHADRELPPADGDEMQALMNQHIKEMVLVFGTHGHSGFSASYAIALLEKILRFQPLRINGLRLACHGKCHRLRRAWTGSTGIEPAEASAWPSPAGYLMTGD